MNYIERFIYIYIRSRSSEILNLLKFFRTYLREKSN